MTAKSFSAVLQSVKSNMEKKKEQCRRCGRELTADDMGATKKFVNRGSTAYYCLDCLAESLDVARTDLEKKIVYFREMGCTLFQD